MEASLLLILVGAAQFAASRLASNRSDLCRLAALIFSGMIVSGILYFAGVLRFSPILAFPFTAALFFGALSGIILFRAEKTSLLTGRRIQAFSTLILGLIHGIASFAAFTATGRLFHLQWLPSGYPLQVLAVCLLAGFLIFFGYTMPQRHFLNRQRRMERRFADREEHR
ncbi:hypothetical protein JW906_08820 [bacterium]|nr:hypothetical protein [bacterium]